MQPTTSMDIQEMQNHINPNVNTPELNRESVDNNQVEPETLEEVTTAPQDQLDKIENNMPKQPVGNNQNP